MIEELEPYKEYIKLFAPIEGIKTSFIAQNIRLLYPCLLKNTKGGVLITDIDIIPMNSQYYIKSIESIHNNKFVSYRQLECAGKNEIIICYNIAHQNIWQEIFNIKTLLDINKILMALCNNKKYIGHQIRCPAFWITDQLYLYEKAKEWNNKTNNLVILNDSLTKFHRLDRHRLPQKHLLINNIKNGYYSDYHMYRPYEQYKQINDFIVDLL